VSKDIALRSDFPVGITEQMQMSKALAQAGVLPEHLRRQPANIMAIGFAARALDIPTWTALQQVVPIDGKVTIQADLMRALVLRANHKFRVISASPSEATVVVVRHDDPDFEHRVTVRIEEIPDELTRKKNWQNYRADMLVARATSKVCRRACSDVLNGMIYTPDELGADVDDDGTVVSVAQATGEPDAQAAGLNDDAARLRAAAESEAAKADDGADIVDAEVVDEPGDQGDTADTPAAAPVDEPAATPAAGEFPESEHNDPFGEGEPTDPHADRPVVKVGPMRKALIKQVEGVFGEGWQKSIENAMDGVPFERISDEELRQFAFPEKESA
jgi:hypothetical protein